MPVLLHCHIINLIRGLPRGIHFMRHPTDMPAEKIMRFFTPELYMQFNSPDDEVSDRANQAWEDALRGYKQLLETIRPRMPSQVRKVSELCLHDAEVLGFEQEIQSLFPFPEPFWPGPLWSAVAILSLKQECTVWSLIYMLWDRVRHNAATEEWQFSKSPKLWLYDE